MKTSGQPKIEQRAGQGKSRNNPKRAGGTIIRRAIKTLRSSGLPLPFKRFSGSQILIACSGGLDSTALAVLIAKYGKTIAKEVGLLHVNHGWRGLESDADALYVEKLAGKLSVPYILESLDPKLKPPGASSEEWARSERKRLFRKHAGPRGIVFTGHQADELCETLLWRLFTGAAGTHGAGILVRDGLEVRPLLSVYKSELQEFLQEEGVSWREDSTNTDPQLMRGGLRTSLVPSLDRQFPQWRAHLIRYSGNTKASGAPPENPSAVTGQWIADWFGNAGVRLRRVHREKIQSWLKIMGETRVRTRSGGSRRVLDSMDVEKGWRVILEADPVTGKSRVVVDRHTATPSES